LNHILSDNTHGMKFAVIENEFGEIGIDEKILHENVEEEVVEVMNGQWFWLFHCTLSQLS
jgi:G3E family GTPase